MHGNDFNLLGVSIAKYLGLTPKALHRYFGIRAKVAYSNAKSHANLYLVTLQVGLILSRITIINPYEDKGIVDISLLDHWSGHSRCFIRLICLRKVI